MLTIEEMSEKLADVCFRPKENGSEEHAVQLFIEGHVLAKEIESYTKDELKKYINLYLRSVIWLKN